MIHFLHKQCIGFILAFSFVYSFCGAKEKNDAVFTNTNSDNLAVASNINRDKFNSQSVQESDEKVEVDIDPFTLPVISKVKGDHLKAISTALEAFNIDAMIPETQRNIQNYDVELRENKDYFFVYLSPHMSVEDKKHLPDGGETSLGKSVMFILSKKDSAIKKRYFFK